MYAICIHRFDMTLLEARRTSLYEFNIYSKAYRLRKEENLELIHRQAWLNQQVKSTKGKGKHVRAVFQRFDDFYDVEVRQYMALKDEYPQLSSKQLNIAEMNQRINSDEFNERVKIRAEEIRKQREEENNGKRS